MRKPTFDSLCLCCVSQGLQHLRGGRIQHIAQPNESQIVLTIYNPQLGDCRLMLDCSATHPRAYLITRKPPNPKQPPVFCMTLRKYLEGGFVREIGQRGFDRILDIEVDGHLGERLLLTTEMMGKHSNILLVDSQQKVLHAAKLVNSKMNRVREMMPGHPYTPPPLSAGVDPRTMDRAGFDLLLSNGEGEDLTERLCANLQGISPILREELAARANFDGPATPDSLWTACTEIFGAAVKGEWEPVLIRTEGGASMGAYPFPLASLRELEQHPREDFQGAAEASFSSMIGRERLEQSRKTLLGMLKRSFETRERMMAQLHHAAMEAKKADSYREAGDLLLASLHLVPAEATEVVLPDLYHPEQGDRKIILDAKLSPQENAQRYFHKSRQAIRALARMQQVSEGMQQEMDDLQVLMQKVEAVDEREELESLRQIALTKSWLQALPGKVAAAKEAAFDGKRISRMTSLEGYEVLIGQNAEANDYLVQRLAGTNDMWLHVRGGHGGHVIIRTNNQPLKVPKGTILFAAEQAAKNSTAKHSSLVAIDCTLRKYVRRPRGGAPGLVTYTHEKTYHVSPAGDEI